MIDHAEIAFGDWAIRGPATEVVRFVAALPEIAAKTKGRSEVKVFTAPSGPPDARWVNAELSKGKRGNIVYQTLPLVGGTLITAQGKERVPRHTPGEHVRLGIDGHLNVNRFLMAQKIRWSSRLDRQRFKFPLATAIEGTPAASGTEYCLTDDMNLIIGPDPVYRKALSKPAEDHFMDCLRLMETFMTTELQDTAKSYGVTVVHLPYYSLRKIEFVWEFEHPNPIRFVEGLDVPMRALGPQSRRHRALVRGESLRVKQDSLSISAELSAGCDLIVYAKTNERVRFEVRLDRDAIGMILKKRNGQDATGSENTDQKGRTTRNHDQLRRMVERLREAATERFQTALAMLDRQRVPPASDVTALRLCAVVGHILQDDDLAHTVLETLRMRRSLASPLHSTMRGAADKLIEAKVLRRSAPRSPVFVPTDRYVRAVEELRGYGAPPPALPHPPSVERQDGATRRGGIVRRTHWPDAGRN